MKHFITATLAALSLGMVTSSVQAQEPVSDPAMMIYYSMPFGGKSRKQETPTYGFRLDTVESSPDSGITFASFTGKHAMMDFAMNEDGAKALSFNGVNTLEKTTVYNADAGTTTTTTAINWGLVAIGVIGVATILANDDDDECKPVYGMMPNFRFDGIYRLYDPCRPI